MLWTGYVHFTGDFVVSYIVMDTTSYVIIVGVDGNLIEAENSEKIQISQY